MWPLIWPILVVVGANAFYNVIAKTTPKGIDAFASLSVSYLVAAAVSAVMFFITGAQKNLGVELAKANWTTIALGVFIVGLEFGTIHMYRAGWKVSVASLVANISLACVLLLVGLMLYKEHVTLRQVIGIAVCAAGLFLIGK
ncbi:MAG: EamA family transporter [Clostridiaceae bacterium]|nr:EamA family transporter [Eubacteriales bacterium]